MAKGSRRKRKAASSPAFSTRQGASPSGFSSPYLPRARAWDSMTLWSMPPRLAQWTAMRPDRMARADSLLATHQQRVARSTSETKRHHSKLSFSSPSPADRQSSDRARDPKCKERPDSKKAARSPKGSGGPRKFVPWC